MRWRTLLPIFAVTTSLLAAAGSSMIDILGRFSAPDVPALQDWKNLGPATTAQFLDQPGVPEKPGDLQR